MADTGTFTVQELLRGAESLRGKPELADAAVRVFEFARFLLDDDANLTRTGNLSGAAGERLRARILELLGAADPAPAEGAPTSAEPPPEAGS